MREKQVRSFMYSLIVNDFFRSRFDGGLGLEKYLTSRLATFPTRHRKGPQAQPGREKIERRPSLLFGEPPCKRRAL